MNGGFVSLKMEKTGFSISVLTDKQNSLQRGQQQVTLQM